MVDWLANWQCCRSKIAIENGGGGILKIHGLFQLDRASLAEFAYKKQWKMKGPGYVPSHMVTEYRLQISAAASDISHATAWQDMTN